MPGLVVGALVDDRVDGDGGLAGPIMSSLWPRPIGIIESIAMIPVWRGSVTG